MKSILVVCPDRHDATAFYRATGPLSALRREVSDLIVNYTGSEIYYSDVLINDICFLQRPFRTADLQVAEWANALSRPLWVDFDDDLFCVPSDNGAFQIFGNKDVQMRISQICSRADVITVTTQALKERLSEFNKNVHVVPNAIDDFSFPSRRKRQSPRNKLVFWRGSNTHQRDLKTIAKEFIEVGNMEEFKSWHFTFLGYNPWFITEELPTNRCVVSDAISPEKYFGFMEEFNHAIQIVPLHDNAFNRSKSNIAWIEGSLAGAAIIAANLPEWRHPGCLLYDNPEEFKQVLIDSMREKYDLEKINSDGWEHVKKEFSLSVVNLTRAKILESLYRKRRGFIS